MPQLCPRFFFFSLQITEKPCCRSRIAVVVDPSRHPRLRLGDVGFDFPPFALVRFLFDPHGVVAGDGVLLTRALEKATLWGGETQGELVEGGGRVSPCEKLEAMREAWRRLRQLVRVNGLQKRRQTEQLEAAANKWRRRGRRGNNSTSKFRDTYCTTRVVNFLNRLSTICVQ